MDPEVQITGDIGKGGTIKKKGGKGISTFFKKNMTMTRHFVLQAVGKADQLEFPLLCEQEGMYFKNGVIHYKEMEKVIKKLTKDTSALETDEIQVGEIMKRYSKHLDEEREMRSREEELLAESQTHVQAGYSNNNNNSNNSSQEQDGESLMGRQFFTRDEERQKLNEEVLDDLRNMSIMFSEFGSTFQKIGGLRTELTERLSNSYLPKLSTMLDDTNTCRDTKERYRQALSAYSTERTKLRTLKQKSNDLYKIGNSEKDHAEAKKRSELEFEDMMDEYEYNVLQRNTSYVDNVKDMIIAYRLYFARGAEMLAELEETLQLPTMRRPDLERKPKRYQPVKNNRSTPSRQAEQRFLNQKTYGSTLEEVMQRDNETGEVPRVFEYLVDFIETHGILIEGIFRISGDSTETSICKKRVDKGLQLDLDPANQRAIHIAASLLKQYIRELPDPLLTYDKYSAFTDASQLPDGEEKIQTFADLLGDLPPHNALLLNLLCELLCKVESHAAENKMTFANLAIVFGMNIIHPEDTSNPLMLIKDSKKMNDTCQFLLEHYANRFRPILTAYRGRLPEKNPSITQGSHETNDDMNTTPPSPQVQEKRFLPPPTSLAPATAFTAREKPTRPLPKPPQPRSSLPRPPSTARAPRQQADKVTPSLPTQRSKTLPSAPRDPVPQTGTRAVSPKIYPQVRASTPTSNSSTDSVHSGSGNSTHFDSVPLNDDYFNETNPYSESVEQFNMYPPIEDNGSDDDLLEF